MKRFRAYLKEKGDKVSYTLGLSNIAELPKGSLLIKVLYSAVNEADVAIFSGCSNLLNQYPKTPGMDASGIVVESSSPNFKIGDEVIVTGFGLGVTFEGSFADYIRVPDKIAIKIPSGTNMLESMILGSDGLTATMATLRLISEGSNVDKSSNTVVVIGATSTVGCIAITLLKRMKFNIVAVTGYNDKKEYLTTLGADEIISNSNFLELSKSNSNKYFGAIDTIGGEYLKSSINIIKSGGTIVTTSFINKATIELNSSSLVSGLIDIFGIHSIFCDMDTKMFVWDQLSAYGDSKMLLWLLNEIAMEDLPAYTDFVKSSNVNGRLVINHSL